MIEKQVWSTESRGWLVRSPEGGENGVPRLAENGVFREVRTEYLGRRMVDPGKSKHGVPRMGENGVPRKM